MALLSLDRHDVLETIRQSNGLHEAFLRVAKLPAVGEYRTATNADRIRSMSDEELAEFLDGATNCYCFPCTRDINNLKHFNNCKHENGTCEKEWLEWLKREMEGEIING